MKRKTIHAIIKGKINEWLATIEDAELQDHLRNNVMVTGGCIASMLTGNPVNDFDVYLRTRETAARLARYYVDRFQPKARNGIECAITVMETDDRVKIVIKSAGIASENGAEKAYEYFEARPADEAGAYVDEIMDDPGEIQDQYEKLEESAQQAETQPRYRPVFMSTNAITLANRIQIVLRFSGEPDEIHENYDFVHCTNYWTSWNDEVVLRPDALEALLAKELRYIGSRYPICSVFRLRKFLKRDWTINAGQILKMALQISKLDLENPAVLEDQLTGVDCAYFVEVIEKMKEKNPDRIDATYLVEIINRMF